MRISKTGMIGEGIKFQRVRRITGYLVQTISSMNNAKRAEVSDRVTHGEQPCERHFDFRPTQTQDKDNTIQRHAADRAELSTAASPAITEIVLDDGRRMEVLLVDVHDAQLPVARAVGTCCGHPVFAGEGTQPYVSGDVEHDLHQVSNTLQRYDARWEHCQAAYFQQIEADTRVSLYYEMEDDEEMG